jgi:hypothetical protein
MEVSSLPMKEAIFIDKRLTSVGFWPMNGNIFPWPGLADRRCRIQKQNKKKNALPPVLSSHRSTTMLGPRSALLPSKGRRRRPVDTATIGQGREETRSYRHHSGLNPCCHHHQRGEGGAPQPPPPSDGEGGDPQLPPPSEGEGGGLQLP